MNTTSAALYLGHADIHATLENIKKKHPLFQPELVADDWFLNHGTWTLTESAITRLLADYRNTLEAHNTGLSHQISLAEDEIRLLQEALKQLPIWNKEKRGEITARIGKLKANLRDTKSETVQLELQRQKEALDNELATMTHDRNARRAHEETLTKKREHNKKLESQKIPSAQLAKLAEDLEWVLQNLEITLPKTPASSPVRLPRVPFLESTRGKVATILVGLSAGVGFAWWNVADQVKNGVRKPVNLLERGMRWTNNPATSYDWSNLMDADRQAMVMAIEHKIRVAKERLLKEVSENGDIQGLWVRLTDYISQTPWTPSRKIYVEEKYGENGCSTFNILYEEGNMTCVDVLGTSEIFHSIDDWITKTVIENDVKIRIEPMILAMSMNTVIPESTRRANIEFSAQSILSDIFDKSMQKNGFTLNMTQSGIAWHEQTGRPALQIIYRLGTSAIDQALLIPFSKLPH